MIELNWRKTSKVMKENQQLVKIPNIDKIIQSLRENNEQIQILYSATHAYFQAKRSQCFRFYFLSNSEITKIYSENKEKEFRSLNPFMEYLFPTVKKINFRADEQVPFEMQNLDGERLALKFGRSSNFEIE